MGNSGFGCGAISERIATGGVAGRIQTAAAAFPATARLAVPRTAQVAFDHRQPIDDMAERVVNGFERNLGVAAAFGLAEADIGQFALDDLGKVAIRGRTTLRLLSVKRGKLACCCFEMAQNVLQPILDRTEIDRSTVIGGRFEAFEQIGHPLFKVGECGCAVVADGHPIDAVGQCPQRAFELFGTFACAGALAAFQRRSQSGDALFEHGEGIAAGLGAGKLVDLGRERVDVVAEPGQRVG